MFKALIRLLALLVALQPAMVGAQTFPTIPDRSVIGRIGAGGQSGPSQAIPFATLKAQLGVSTVSIAALRALPAGVSDAVDVLDYYSTTATGGGGRFLWSSASTAADNGGSIIAPSSGATGRWIRQTAIPNQFTPEMFGAKADGTSDANTIDDLMTYLGTVTSAGGTMQLSCGKTYTLALPTGTGPYGSRGNGLSIIRAFSNVNIAGCGPSSIIKMANGVNTSSAFFASGIYRDGTLNNVKFSNFTIDMNGAQNSCSATCYHSNVALGAYNGDDINVLGVKFINNPGSNDTVFGTNANPPTVTNLRLVGLLHEHSGDVVNAASTDFSADFFIASGVTYSDIRCSDGPRVNGSCFEMHGRGVTASNIVVTDYFNGGIIANETASPVTNDINLSSFKLNNVKNGLQIYSRASATNTNINISGPSSIKFLAGFSGMGIDACSNISATTGSNINLSISGVEIYSDVTTNLGNDTSGICIGRWLSAKANNNQTYNTQGPGIRFIASVNLAALTAIGNQISYPGRTNNAALQAGIVIDATGGITTDNIDVLNNPVTGTVRYAVINAQNSTAGKIIGDASGATVQQVNNSGTGVFAYLFPGSSLTLAGIDIGQTFTALQRFTDQNFALVGSTSGTLVQRAPAVAGSSVLRWPAGSTDFSATGPGVVRQASLGAALTVAPVAAADMPALTGACTTSAGAVATSCLINTPALFSSGNYTSIVQNTTFYMGIGTLSSTTSGNQRFGQAGTLKNLYCETFTAPAGSQTATYTVRVNGVDSSVVSVITGAATDSVADTTHTVAVAAGDKVDIKLVTSATAATSARSSCGMTLVTTSP